MRQPCQNGIGFKHQPRFQLVKNCKYRNYLSDKDLWYFFKLKQRVNAHGNHQLFMDEEANLFRKNIRDLIGGEVNALVEEGNYGSIVCNHKKEKFIYYIVGLIGGVPWTDQETRHHMCDAVIVTPFT